MCTRHEGTVARSAVFDVHLIPLGTLGQPCPVCVNASLVVVRVCLFCDYYVNHSQTPQAYAPVSICESRACSAMVRLLLLAKSIEQQFLRRANQLDDQQAAVVADVLKLDGMHGGASPRALIIALCTDGGSFVGDSSVAQGLEQLYSLLKRRGFMEVDVVAEVRHFSFLSSDIATQAAVLRSADIFWFAGVHAVPSRYREVLCPNRDECDAGNLAALLRRRVQYDGMPYIGICGGAIMAGDPRTSKYGVGLDLLQGAEIEYAWSKEVTWHRNKMFFTNQCCLGLVLTVKKCDVAFFPVVKNAGGLWGFASESQEALRGNLHWIGGVWKDYGTWSFSVRGWCYFHDSKEMRQILQV